MNHKEEFLSKNQQIIFDFIEKAKSHLRLIPFYLMFKKKELKHHYKFIEH